MKIDSNQHQYAIYCNNSHGPTFGGGHDIHICSNASKTNGSYSNLGNTYRKTQYADYDSDDDGRQYSSSLVFVPVSVSLALR